MLRWNGAMITARVKQAALRGLSDGAEFLLDESNKDAPHDEGILEGSGVATVDESKMTSCVSYGGAASAYVKRLHEHPEYKFQKGRKGKWLELALKDNVAQIYDHIGNSIKAAIGR